MGKKMTNVRRNAEIWKEKESHQTSPKERILASGDIDEETRL